MLLVPEIDSSFPSIWKPKLSSHLHLSLGTLNCSPFSVILLAAELVEIFHLKTRQVDRRKNQCCELGKHGWLAEPEYVLDYTILSKTGSIQGLSRETCIFLCFITLEKRICLADYAASALGEEKRNNDIEQILPVCASYQSNFKVVGTKRSLSSETRIGPEW